MVDDLLDLLLFIVLLSVTVPLGYSQVVDTYRETKVAVKNLGEDKNTKRTEGYGITSTTDFDGTYSKYDVVLMTQIQDAYMGEPGLVYVVNQTGSSDGAYSFRVNTDYTSNLANHAIYSWKVLSASNSDFEILYGYNETLGNFWKIVELEE